MCCDGMNEVRITEQAMLLMKANTTAQHCIMLLRHSPVQYPKASTRCHSLQTEEATFGLQSFFFLPPTDSKM